MFKLFTLLHYSPWDYNRKKLLLSFLLYISPISILQLSLEALCREVSLFPVNIVLITSACHKTGNSNFCKFLTGSHPVFKEVKKYLIVINWGKGDAKKAAKVVWALSPLVLLCVTLQQSPMEEKNIEIYWTKDAIEYNFIKHMGSL